MTKDVTVQEMQEHFAEHMEEVRRGVTIRLVEGENLIAELAPAAELLESEDPEDMILRPATGRFCDFVPPPPIDVEIDVVALLREDRDAR